MLVFWYFGLCVKGLVLGLRIGLGLRYMLGIRVRVRVMILGFSGF